MSNKFKNLNWSNNSNGLQDNNSKGNKEHHLFFNLPSSRIWSVVIVFFALVLIIVARLLWLQVFDVEANKKAAKDTRTISYQIKPKRGTIYDRNGNVLAFSKEACSVYANPSEIENVNEAALILSRELNETTDYINNLIDDSNKKFVYIKRHIENDVGDKIKEHNIKGIYLEEDTRREYPYGEIAGQIVGACNIDGDGLCGLELYYDDVLRGSTGQTVRQQGPSGMPMPGGTLQETAVVDGQDIMISIDIEIQQKLQEILANNNSKMGSKSMNATIIDPRSGEIYASASLPYFNPANTESAQEGSTELKGVSSTYEPGSTFKTVAAMSILEDGVLTPESQIFCPNSLAADEYVVTDSHPRASQTFTFRQIIARSSNVGISLATEKLGFQKFYEKIGRYNFNKNTNIDFPGDASGYLLDYKDWSKIQSYNVSFGQGITVTPMQILKFYSSIINNGVEKTPHFLMRYLQAEKDEEYEEYDVIDNKAAIPVVIDMLRSVVTEGTGNLAYIPHYGVAGKTGTGEIADSNGKYLSGIYYNSFVGFLSQASIPMTCFVGAERVPSEQSVTQVYKDIMTFVIERLRIVGQG